MKKLLSTTAIILALISTPALAHMEGDNGTPFAMETGLSKLSPAHAQQFRNTMKESRDENKDLMNQAHQLHRELHAILVAPTFDQDAFLDKSKQLRDVHAQMEANLNESFTTAASHLSQNERRSLADSWHHEKHGKHWAHHAHGAADSSAASGEGHESEQYPSPSSTPCQTLTR